MQISDLTIRSLRPPEKGHSYVWEDSGLGVRVSPKGTKTFCVLIGSGRRQTIGRYPAIKLADARKEAQRIRAEKILGKVRPTHTAFEDALKEFLADRAAARRASTVASYKRHLTKHYPYGRSSLASITSRMILGRLDRLSKSERQHAFAAGRVFFRYCVSRSYIDRSPMGDMQAPSLSKPRERVLTDAELRQLCQLVFAPENHFHRIIGLCITTGQRRGEITRFERSWRDGDTIALPSHITKNARAHTVVLGQIAQRLLDTAPHLSDVYYFPAARDRFPSKPATVFNGWGKSKAELDKELKIAPWTIHDLRRTFSTGLASIGIAPHIIERIINHATGVISGVSAVYNRYSFLPEMREAMAKWEQHLAKLLKDKSRGTDELSAADAGVSRQPHQAEGSPTTTAPGA